ncbi:hypothetical protein B0J14DRAFT_657692 [Halenospora varia]|nr:hypothetical protein B0J14DRAFT_657692 [Halenospora varia]
MYSDYYRVKLMLHYLFVNWEDLLYINGQTHPEDFYTDLNNEGDNTGSDTETDKDLGPKDGSDIDYLLADFKAFTCRRPQEDFTDMDLGQDIGA